MKYTVEKFFEGIKDDIYALGFEEGIAFPHNNAIDFFKDNNKHIISLNCYNDQYNKNKFVCEDYLRCRISLKEVNDILFQFIPEGNNENYIVSSMPHYDFHRDFLQPLKGKYIEKVEDLSFVKDLLVEYISKYILPFFSEINTAQDVNDKILDVLPWNEWNNYIPGKTYYKAIIILKLSKSKQYEEFYSMYYNRVNGFFENGMTELSDFLIILSKLKLYLDENY